MGHERLGFLPKSKSWRQIVEHIAHFDGSAEQTAVLAQATLHNVQTKFLNLPTDQGFTSSLKFLVSLSYAFGTEDPASFCSNQHINLPSQATPLALGIELRRWLPPAKLSEVGHIAQQAATDAMADFYRSRSEQTPDLFGKSINSSRWADAATGAGFCELSRSFFSHYTRRYLNYFLEREAAAAMGSVDGRERLKSSISAHTDAVSKHAFETAKITQSFSAAWFNKKSKSGFPREAEIRGFIRIASGKMFDEIRREAEK